MRASLAADDRANRKTLAVVSISGGKDSTAMALLIACSSLFAMTVNASATEVWVVTDKQHPVTMTLGVRVIELDAPSRIEAELSTHLPSDAKQAAAIVKQRLMDGGVELQRRLASAYQGVTDAWRLGITKIPAVIVDRKYVIYGESDLHRAISRIEDYRRVRS